MQYFGWGNIDVQEIGITHPFSSLFSLATLPIKSRFISNLYTCKFRNDLLCDKTQQRQKYYLIEQTSQKSYEM